MNNFLLGLRIKEARISRGYTLDNLADAVGLNKSTVSRYERGEIDSPKLPVIQAIASELHVNPSWLVGKSDDKTYTPPDSGFALLKPCNLFKPLKPLREVLGLTTSDVALHIGISEEDYKAIEAGCNTDCITLTLIANFFCCDTDHILSYNGIINEETYIEFTKSKLLRLNRVFMNLSSEDQEKVISYAQSLAAKNLVTFKRVGRDGSYKEETLTKEEYAEMVEQLDKLPDVPEGL